eukprot:CAMPEP_0202481106 /NCGR_PEP_ID=MMETSP1361-20130828/831_1 /ASSEMBLY_ACC=CAM_ASM_000849 /TAXON_ID=210615 /ORGANISM="Staurosira complex sp., Strain CCMP2646" /LENGTH=279 /DNA_ID=CAMNT_0049108599 /DNA_START=97 /DNA_END=936 /DNA_ORIENTATION=+
MASSGDPEPAWLDADNDNGKEDTPLMGSGDVVLHDTGTDVEAASDNAKDAASYGALDIKETTDEDATPKRRQDEDWHKDKPAAKKKKRAKKKHVRVSESLHEILVNRPHRPCCLHIFIFIEIVAILASLNLLITEIIPIIIAPPSKIGYLSLALRCYLSCFCLVFISVELEIPVPFIKDSQIFNNWISRGFLYSFVGLIGMEEAYSSRVEDLVGNANDKFHVAWVPMFMQITSWIMFAVGCCYMVLGICCLRRLRDKLRDSFHERVKEYNSTTVIAASE